MSTAQHDGGPAYPAERPLLLEGAKQPIRQKFSGMSLRDHFAGLAMSAFMQGATNMGSLEPSEVDRQFLMVGEFAYRAADAMLKARGG